MKVNNGALSILNCKLVVGFKFCVVNNDDITSFHKTSRAASTQSKIAGGSVKKIKKVMEEIQSC